MLFLISGFLVAHSINDFNWLRARIRGLLVPLLFGLVTIIPLSAYLSPEIMPPERTSGQPLFLPLEPLHLWFLIDLIVFSCITYLMSSKLQLLEKIIDKYSMNKVLLSISLLFIIFSVVSTYFLYLAKEQGQVNIIWISIISRLPKYFFIYLLGFTCSLHENRNFSVKRNFLICVLLCATFLTMPFYIDSNSYVFVKLTKSAFIPILSLVLGLSMLRLGIKLQVRNAITIYMRKSSYTVYMFHILGLAIFGNLFGYTNSYTLFLMSIAFSIAFSLLCYEIIIRSKLLRMAFHGQMK